MKYSRHNIFSRIRNSENFFIVNLLSGHADILSPDEAVKMEELKKGSDPGQSHLAIQAIENGYFVDEEEERTEFRRKYLDFIDSRAKDEVQIFFVPDYSCNFACPYCYQDQYGNAGKACDNSVIDTFFSYIGKEFSSRRKYITIFGGEPLLNSPARRRLIDYFTAKAAEADLSYCVVTNGYFLEDYIPVLGKGRIREIQVTLDGTADVHNSRRFMKGGGSTFSKIVNGIDAALAAGFDVNLRMVADRENIGNLPDLARFAIDKGWTKNPHFKTQIGRNYELHHCQTSPGNLFDRVSLYEKIFELTKEFPHILEFHKPAYSVSKFLAENGELPGPLFDSCPACKTEWAFDYTGNIYSCTATVGKEGESLGTFYPAVTRSNDIIEEWEARDVATIPECRDCSLQLACGGGCGSVAKNRTGTITSPDCRPVKELMGMGFRAYLDE